MVIDTDEIKTDETALNILTHVNILDVVKKTLIDNKENIEENSFKTDLSKYYDNFHKNFLVFGEAVENEFNLTTMNFFYSLENKPVLPLTPCDASLFRLFNKKDLKEIKIIQIDDIQVFKTNNNFLLIGSPRAKSNPTYYLPCKFKKKDLGTLEIDNFLFGENFTKFDNHLKILCDKENSNLTMNVYKANESDLIESKTIKYNFISYIDDDLSKLEFRTKLNFFANTELRKRLEKLPKLKIVISKLIPNSEYISMSLIANIENLNFTIGRIKK